MLTLVSKYNKVMYVRNNCANNVRTLLDRMKRSKNNKNNTLFQSIEVMADAAAAAVPATKVRKVS